MHTVIRATALLALLFAVGCSNSPTLGKPSRATSLETSLESYRKLIRWGYYDEAVKYLRAPDGSIPRFDLDRMARYRVTAYEPRSQLLADTGKEARVMAIVEYYEIDRGTIATVSDEQLWWYDDESKHWYLSSGLPPFGVEGKAKGAALVR